jgi:hypothetical protein
MESWMIVVAVLVIAAIAGAAWFTMQRRRSEELQGQFGPEYERAVEQSDSRSAAERELDDRRKRVGEMELRPLDPAQRDEYLTTWKRVQADFVDDPSGAITRADSLIDEVMEARGYPTGTDFETRAGDLSVNHPRVVSEYRAARDVAEHHAAEGVPTEALRRGFVHYRTLFEDLLETDSTEDQPAPVPAETARAR